MDIQSLLTPPDNWRWDYFESRNGDRLRYGFTIPKNPKALIVLAEGRTETAEEYFEIIRRFYSQGYAVAIMDWQGQGLSYRYNNDNSRHHSEAFEVDIDDFSEFLNILDTNTDLASLPKILIAHSMGGNITLRYMADHPDTFRCALMIAPMLGLKPKWMVRLLALPLLALATRFRFLDKYAIGQMKWNEMVANKAKYFVSSDPVRREIQPHLFKTRPELQCGGVTYGWVKEALKSITLLQSPNIAKRITTPTLFAIAGKDRVIDNDKAYTLMTFMPHAATVYIKNAMHQIHQETDLIQTPLWEAFETFLQKHLSSEM